MIYENCTIVSNKLFKLWTEKTAWGSEINSERINASYINNQSIQDFGPDGFINPNSPICKLRKIRKFITTETPVATTDT